MAMHIFPVKSKLSLQGLTRTRHLFNVKYSTENLRCRKPDIILTGMSR